MEWYPTVGNCRLAKEAAEARLLEEKKRLKRQQEMRREKLKQDEAKAVTLKYAYKYYI